MRVTLSERGFIRILFLLAAAFCSGRAQDSVWTDVWNGTDLTGLKIYGGGSAKVAAGVIDVTGNNSYLATIKEYSHYRVQVEWKNVGGGNSGYLYHIGKDGVWPSGLECQMQQGDVGSLWTTDCKFNSTGSGTTYGETGGAVTGFGVYGSGRKHFLKSSNQENVGQWNKWEMYVESDSLEIKVNDKVVMRISKLTIGPGTPLVKGRMGLQIEGSEVQWRNWKVMDLSNSTRIMPVTLNAPARKAAYMDFGLAAGRASVIRALEGGTFAAFKLNGSALRISHIGSAGR